MWYHQGCWWPKLCVLAHALIYCLFFVSSQVTINSRGLVYSVILLLASVTLTVSSSTFISLLFLSTPESPHAVSRETWAHPLMVAWQEMKISLSLSLSVCLSRLRSCVSTWTAGGWTAGWDSVCSCSTSSSSSAPLALRVFRPHPVSLSSHIIKSDVQRDPFFFFSHSGSSVSRTGRKTAALIIFDKGVFYIVLYWALTQHIFGEF